MGAKFTIPQFKLPEIDLDKIPVSTTVNLMSVYHPFPLRIDSNGTGSLVQYDACLQIGEFKTQNRASDPIVVLIPLAKTNRPGTEAEFINAFGQKIPNILGAQPDRDNGYPDVPAATGTDWSISKVLKTDRPFYTWMNSDQTRVIIMAEPIFVSEPDLTNIQRLPITPPEDVFHEIGKNIRYKAGPPVDNRGNPVPCPPTGPPPFVPSPKFKEQAKATEQVQKHKSAMDPHKFLEIIWGSIGVILIIIAVWVGIKLAMGPGQGVLQGISNAVTSVFASVQKAAMGAKAAAVTATKPTPPPESKPTPPPKPDRVALEPVPVDRTRPPNNGLGESKSDQ